MIPIKGQEFIGCGSVSEEELKTQILGASRRDFAQSVYPGEFGDIRSKDFRARAEGHENSGTSSISHIDVLIAHSHGIIL